MKLAIYYIVILFIIAILYIAANKANEKKKRPIEYLCYFGIFLELLIFI